MNEKEKGKWLDIINDFEHDFAAIAAYQLTRIADQGEPVTRVGVAAKFIEIPDDKGNVHHFYLKDLKNYRDGYFQYEPQGGFKTPMTATDILDCIENATPAPDVPTDALVEADQAYRKRMDATKSDALVEGLKEIIEGDWIIPVDAIAIAEKALAAHKKAVR